MSFRYHPQLAPTDSHSGPRPQGFVSRDRLSVGIFYLYTRPPTWRQHCT